MNRGLDKQSLLGIILAVVILGVAGWLLLTRNNGDSGNQKIDQFGDNAKGALILRPELDSTLVTNSRGMEVTRSGSGVLKDGAKWSFVQYLPNSGGTIMDATGKEVTIPSGGVGAGATLVIEPVASVQTAESDLRSTLSDVGVKLGLNGNQYQISSSTLTAATVVLSKQKLTVSGLFLRSQCKSKQKALNANLAASCKNVG